MLKSIHRLPVLARIRPRTCIHSSLRVRFASATQAQTTEPTAGPFTGGRIAKNSPKLVRKSVPRAVRDGDRPKTVGKNGPQVPGHDRVIQRRNSYRNPGPGDGSRSSRAALPVLRRKPSEKTVSSPVNHDSLTTKKPKESFIVRKEMEYLIDKVRLAGRVQALLAANDYDLAVQLAEAGTRRKMDTVVSWNLIIRYLFAQKKVQAAIKTYNDMKKRGEKPTHWTYSALLSGLQKNPHVPTSLEVALAIFRSIESTNPPPATFNPLLSLCATRQEYTLMEEIFEKLPKSGPGKPDHSTYLLIFEALKSRARSATPKERAEVSLQARKIWADIVQQWKNRQLKMDDYLPSIMAETLLSCGRREDTDDIFSLVEQVFGIARFTPRLSLVEKEDGSLFTNDMLSALSPDHNFSASEKRHHLDAGNVFESTGVITILPTSHVLSALLKAATELRVHEAADYYFTTLRSEPYNVAVSETVWKHYIDHLHYARSGIRAVKTVMEEVPDSGVKPTLYMYRRAVTACCRNWRDPETFAAATRVVEYLLEKNKPDPDMMESWIEIARKQAEAPESEALSKMRLMGPRLRDIVLKNGASTSRIWLSVCSKIVGMYDKVLNSDAIIHWKYRSALQAERLKMSTFVTRMDLLQRQHDSRGKAKVKMAKKDENTAEKEKRLALKETRAAALAKSVLADADSDLEATSIVDEGARFNDELGAEAESAIPPEEHQSAILIKAGELIREGSNVIAQANLAIKENRAKQTVFDTAS